MSTDETKAFEPTPRRISDDTEALDREQRLDEAIASYLRAVQEGEAPHEQEWLTRHADLAAELAEFFADRERVERLAGPVRAAIAAGPAVGSKVGYIGDYELLGELGRGGMGVVYKARQTSLKRTVALKMILAGVHASPQDLARFRDETEAVARLQHPHIVQIHEIGVHEGHPYAALEFVEGGSLDQKLGGTPLPASQAAQLVEVLARAVHAAHQQGIVHRDLKPANILLGRSQRPEAVALGPELEGTERYEPKVTDFGLAKLVKEDAGQTKSGSILGTPSYMAPEQAAGKTKEIGPAADIYALGAILYELLTGRPPFKAETPLATMMQVISEEPASPRQLQPKVPRDLETVCLKCLQKEPGKRYASALALAEDLHRWHYGEPITARPVGTGERLVKWVKRHPAKAGFVATLAVLVLTLSVGGPAVALQQTELREKAVQAKQLAEERAASEAKAKQHALDEKDRADRQLEFARRNLFTAQLLRVSMMYEHDPYEGLQLLHDYNACPIYLRNAAWRFYANQCKKDCLTLGPIDVASLVFSPNGQTLASGCVDQTIKLWDVKTGQEKATYEGHKGGVTSVAFSPDGHALASSGKDGAIKLWDVQTGKEKATLTGHAGGIETVFSSRDGLTPEYQLDTSGVSSVAFSPDGQTLASASYDKTVKLWEVRTGQEKATLKGHTSWVLSVTFSPDGQTLASGSQDQAVKLWDVKTGQEKATYKGHNGGVTSVAFGPDGQTLASGGNDSTLKLWDVRFGQARATLKGHTLNVASVAFSPDGRLLASGGDNNTVKLWNVQTAQEKVAFMGHSGWVGHAVRSVAFRPDGQMLATGGGDKTIKLWQVKTGPEKIVLRGHTSGVTSVALSPDGRTLASGSVDRTIKLWDVRTGRQEAALKGHTDEVCSVAFSPDGLTLASGGGNDDRTIKLWDTQTGQEKATLRPPTVEEVTWLAFSPDGQILASRCDDGLIQLWEVQTGKEKANLQGLTGPVWSVTFSPDFKTLAVGCEDKTIKLWDVRTLTEKSVLRGHARAVHLLAFSPDGQTLAAGSGDQTLKLWDVGTGKEKGILKGHTSDIVSVRFSPDGQTLAGGCGDWTVKLWDIRTGQAQAALQGHTGIVTSVDFSRDGQTLASGSRDNTVKLWDLADSRDVAVLKGHREGTSVRSVAFSLDGKTLKSTDGLGNNLFWDLTTGQRLPDALPENFLPASPRSPDGKLIAEIDRNVIRLINPAVPDELARWQQTAERGRDAFPERD